MIQYFLIALLVMAVITAVAILVAVLQGKRAKKAKQESAALHEAFWQVKEKAERLEKALGDSAKVEEKANEERQELAQTPDAGLAERANSLFVRDSEKHQ
jgi:predicted Holliday junction resolvase-like endonuclease